MFRVVVPMVVRDGLRVVLMLWLSRGVGVRTVLRVGALWVARIGVTRVRWTWGMARGAEIRVVDGLETDGREMEGRDTAGRDTDLGAETLVGAERTGAGRETAGRPAPVRTRWALARSERSRARNAAQAVDRSRIVFTAWSWVSLDASFCKKDTRFLWHHKRLCIN